MVVASKNWLFSVSYLNLLKPQRCMHMPLAETLFFAYKVGLSFTGSSEYSLTALWRVRGLLGVPMNY